MKMNDRPRVDGDTGRPTHESGLAHGFVNTLIDATRSGHPRLAPGPRGGAYGS